MHAFAMLKWTATILLVYISECRGQPSEVLRLADSLGKLKWAFEVLQVNMRGYSLLRPTFVLP